MAMGSGQGIPDSGDKIRKHLTKQTTVSSGKKIRCTITTTHTTYKWTRMAWSMVLCDLSNLGIQHI